MKLSDLSDDDLDNHNDNLKVYIDIQKINLVKLSRDFADGKDSDTYAIEKCIANINEAEEIIKDNEKLIQLREL